MAIVTWSVTPAYASGVQSYPNPTPGLGLWTLSNPTYSFTNGNKTAVNSSGSLISRIDVGSNTTQEGTVYFELAYSLDFDNIGFLFGSMAETGSTIPFHVPQDGGIFTIGKNYNTGLQYVWFRRWISGSLLEDTSIVMPQDLQEGERLGILFDTFAGTILAVSINGVEVLPAMLSGGDLTTWNTNNQWVGVTAGMRAHAQMRAFTQNQTTTVYGNHAEQLYAPDGDGVMIDLGGDLLPIPFVAPPPYPLTLFPLQFKRQQAYPVDLDQVFYSTTERMAYLTSPRRYAGMLVTDAEENIAYLLNNARTEWIPIGTGGTLTIQDEGTPVGAEPTSVINFVGGNVTATSADDGVTVDVTVSGGSGGGGGFAFQIGSAPSAHFHSAMLSMEQAQTLIDTTDPELPVGDAGQPSVVLTSTSTYDHTHDITVFFDYEMHAFYVTEITDNESDQHEANVVGDGPVRYNYTQDVTEYRSRIQGRWVDIATPKVATKTADYTLQITDNQYIFRMDSATPINLIIPNDSDVNIPIGTTCVLSQNGDGAASFQAASGVTVYTPSTYTIAMKYGKASVTKTGANRWEIEGNVGGNIEINASGAPMGGFKAYTASPATAAASLTTTIDLSNAFTTANGFWYGLMDPDNALFDWNHVKVIGGQVTLNSIGSYYITVKAHVTVAGSLLENAPALSYVNVMLTDGNDNVIGIGSAPMLRRGDSEVVAFIPQAGATLSAWMNNDGVSGPFGGNQTVKVKVANPYAGDIDISDVDVCFWYADTRQPRSFSGSTPT